MRDTIIPITPQPTTKPSRLPRFRRVWQPPAMVLTERDKEIVRQIYAYRVMTRDQIERLLFLPDSGQDHPTKTSKARKRLKLLYQHGFLERFAAPTAPGAWAWLPVYRLAKKGAQLVASELGLPVQELPYWGRGDDKDHRKTRASGLFLDHTLALNDLRLAITRAAQIHAYKLELWLDDLHLKSEAMRDYVAVPNDRRGREGVSVIPDAYFVLQLGDRRAHFFLEVDRGTMTNGRWRTRVQAYQEYVRSGKYQDRFRTNSLRILTITTSEARLSNLKRTTARAGGDDLFWFTTLARSNADSVLSSPIWLTASDERDRAHKTLVG